MRSAKTRDFCIIIALLATISVLAVLSYKVDAIGFLTKKSFPKQKISIISTSHAQSQPQVMTISLPSQLSPHHIRIGIISFYHPGCATCERISGANLSRAVFEETVTNWNTYGQKHGYATYLLHEQLFDPKQDSIAHAQWFKVKVLQNYVEKYSDKFDWIFYTGMNFLFTNMTRPLADYIQYARGVCQDEKIFFIGVWGNEGGSECASSSSVFAGNFLLNLRNDLSKQFLKDWAEAISGAYRNARDPEMKFFDSRAFGTKDDMNGKNVKAGGCFGANRALRPGEKMFYRQYAYVFDPPDVATSFGCSKQTNRVDGAFGVYFNASDRLQISNVVKQVRAVFEEYPNQALKLIVP